MLEGPSGWVAFSADVRITDSDGHVTAYGRIYRASNGSERRETHLPGQTFSHVVIFNIPRKLAYFLRPPTAPSWESLPLVLPRAGYHPTRRKLFAEASRSTPVEGFEIWKSSQTPESSVREVAPRLNFYPLIGRDAGGRQELHHIAVAPPAEALFEPPPDAVVVVSLRPMRIGRFTREELGPEFGLSGVPAPPPGGQK
jgi:hypothetical protein